MRTKFIFSLLFLAATAITLAPHEAQAIISAQISVPVPTVSITLDGYLPAPPGVFIQLDAGRPYYVEREQRIYIQENPEHHHHQKKKHHKDQGRKHGHDK